MLDRRISLLSRRPFNASGFITVFVTKLTCLVSTDMSPLYTITSQKSSQTNIITLNLKKSEKYTGKHGEDEMLSTYNISYHYIRIQGVMIDLENIVYRIGQLFTFEHKTAENEHRTYLKAVRR